MLQFCSVLQCGQLKACMFMLGVTSTLSFCLVGGGPSGSLSGSLSGRSRIISTKTTLPWKTLKPQRLSALHASTDNGDEDSTEVSIGWKAGTFQELPTGVMPVIPVPAARVSLPGQLREVHMYDTSNLAVLKYAMKHTGGYYVQVNMWLSEPELYLPFVDSAQCVHDTRTHAPSQKHVAFS